MKYGRCVSAFTISSRISFGLVLVVTSIMLSACSEQIEEVSNLRPVKSMVVLPGGQQRERVFSGTSRSAGETELSFKVAGTVEDIRAEVGDTLGQGDVLATLESDTYQIALEQAQAEVAQANALKRSAEAEYQRIRQLYANDNASRTDLDSALADTESAQASHVAAVRAARLSALELEYTNLISADACAVADIAVEVRENIDAGQRIATASCGSGWEVHIDVPESLIAQFTDGLVGTVRFPSVRDREFRGVVSEVSIGTSGNSSFPVILTLSAAPISIRTNLAADVSFTFTESNADDDMYVPVSAISQDQTGQFTFVANETSEEGVWVLEKRKLDVGELTANGFLIIDGITFGERILVAGHSNARDGMLVRAD